MTPDDSVKRLYFAALARARRLDHAYAVWRDRHDRERTLVVGGLVVELDNLIIGTMRLYALAIVRNAYRGSTIPLPGYSTKLSDLEFSRLVLQIFDPSKLARANRKRRPVERRDEKTVRDPIEWEGFLRALGIPSPPDLTNAISLNFPFPKEMGVVRNFYAHRSKETLDRVKLKFPQLAYGAARHPDEIVTATPYVIVNAKFPQWSFEGKTFLHVAAGQPRR